MNVNLSEFTREITKTQEKVYSGYSTISRVSKKIERINAKEQAVRTEKIAEELIH